MLIGLLCWFRLVVLTLSRHDWKIVDWDVKPQYKQISCLNVPVNIFSIMLGQSHRFLGINQYHRKLEVSRSRKFYEGGRTYCPEVW